MPSPAHALAETPAPQPDLFWQRLHLRVLHPSGKGRVFLSSRATEERGWRGQGVDVYDAARSEHLETADQVSMARFWGHRSSEGVAGISVMALDLDVYNSRLSHLRREEVIDLIHGRLEAAGIPLPSFWGYSGRGLWPAWRFGRICGKGLSWSRWRLCMDMLAGRPRRGRDERERERIAQGAAVFADAGLDRSSLDGARCMRLWGTPHHETGEIARMVWPSCPDEIVDYDFGEISDAILPYTRQEMRAIRAARAAERAAAANTPRPEVDAPEEPRPAKVRRNWRPTDQHFEAVCADLLLLLEHRGREAMRRDHLRNTWLLIFSSCMSWTAAGAGLTKADLAQRYGHLVGFSGARELREATHAMGTVDQRLREHERGQGRTYNGRPCDARYLWSVGRICSDLGITKEEARAAGLAVLTPTGETAQAAAARQAAKRRRDGVPERPDQSAPGRADGERALPMLDAGMSMAAVAKALGRGVTSLRRWVKEARARAALPQADATIREEILPTPPHPESRSIVTSGLPGGSGGGARRNGPSRSRSTPRRRPRLLPPAAMASTPPLPWFGSCWASPFHTPPGTCCSRSCGRTTASAGLLTAPDGPWSPSRPAWPCPPLSATTAP